MNEEDDSKITAEEVKIALDRLRSLSHGDQLQDPSVCSKHRIELLKLKPSDPYYTIKVCPMCVANEVNRVHENYPEIKERMDDRDEDKLIDDLKSAIEDAKNGDTSSLEEVKERIES